MRIFFLWLLRFFLALTALILLYVNLKLYDSPDCTSTPEGSLNADVLRQLHFLHRAIQVEHADSAMQAQYPEGYVFMHALYGLAWCETAEYAGSSPAIRQEALREIVGSLHAMDSPAGKNAFSPDLPLAFGAFYRGWKAYLSGRLLRLTSPSERNTRLVAQFQESCEAIAQAVAQTDRPYLESYPGTAWPADNIVCLAALSLYDQILEPRFRTVKEAWLSRIKRTTLPGYELIPHDFDLENGTSREGARGSSQCLMLVFLPEIDSVFATHQYQNFRKHFLAYRLGLPGIREYPMGVSGTGDIDSGPVVFGMGGAATITGIKAALQFNDWNLAMALRNGAELLLLPQQSASEKTYLFGKLPILDAFLAWSQTGLCAAHRNETGIWRRDFQLISLLILILVAVLYWLTHRSASTNKKEAVPPQHYLSPNQIKPNFSCFPVF